MDKFKESRIKTELLLMILFKACDADALSNKCLSD